MTTLKVSVRNLVEFVLREGDLQSGFTGTSRTLEAIKAHQHIQKTSGDSYLPEVSLHYLFQQEDVSLEIKGRADGIIQKESKVCISEIKTTSLDLELIEESFNNMHWAQAECYAFMYAVQEGLNEIEVQLTYFQLDTEQTKSFIRTFSFHDLSEFFFSLLKRYLEWAYRLQDWSSQRDLSIRNLPFPFENYRPGQRKLAVAVYQTIKHNQKLFAQAPTGIGKTMGTLFPALKALAEGLTTQIFYLTAKTITRIVAEKALFDLYKNGLAVKRLTLTAKEKICFKPEAKCQPEECQFAKGYYDRLRTAVEAIFEEEAWTRQIIEGYAFKYSVCPFEYSLELANWADVVICDYNYIFDPRVYLKRFFLDGGDYTFLVDEAHNLVDRAREMFSAELVKDPWLKLKRLTKDEYPELAKVINKVNSLLANEKKNCLEAADRQIVEREIPVKLNKALKKFIKAAEFFMIKDDYQSLFWMDQFIELYFKALSFIRTAENYDERYVTHWQVDKDDFRVKLFCLDPSARLKEALERGKASILFSATLSPMEYFMSILGGDAGSYKLKLDSPFSAANLCIVINNRISTKYNRRSMTYDQVAEAIASAVEGKEGNYLVYFPSYDYLREVYRRFNLNYQNVKLVCQTPGMTEEEKEEFLAHFVENSGKTIIGFALMGGIFGEGIDLIGERLSGAVIVGVGLPQLCTEREIIRSYFQTTKNQGFEFAYLYPGFNKVLQAAGRVIRTEEDRGIVLLIDERFSNSAYKKLFPVEWQSISYAPTSEEVRRTTEIFWRND